MPQLSHKRILPLLALSGLFALTPSSQAQITIESLVNEMADRDASARFPNSPSYQCLQASSYNRLSTAWDQPNQGTGGWFADSDGTQFIRTEPNSQGQTEWVAMEHSGPGALTKFWTPYFYYSFGNRIGPNIRIYLDGSTTPVIDENFIEFLSRLDWDTSEYGGKPGKQNSFEVPSPFADFTARAGNLYLPIPFTESCKVTFTGRAFFNIINYRAYPEDTEVTSYTQADYIAAASTLSSVGNELNNPTDFTGGALTEQTQSLIQGGEISLSLPAGNAAIRHLEIDLNPAEVAANPEILRNMVLNISFDGAQSVWCPIGDFFSSSNQLNDLQTWERSVDPASGLMKCRWVMPYQSSASVKLINLGPNTTSARLSVRTGSWTWDNNSMHFRANWRPDLINQGNKFMDVNFIDISGKGVLVGDSWTILNLQKDWWGEGDEKIYIDDDYDVAKFPSHFGTGTEDYYGWAGGENPTKLDTFNHPFVANAQVGSFPDNTSQGFNIATRSRALDAIPFHTRLKLDIEASPGTGQRNFHDLLMYSSAVFWYAIPGATDNRPPQAQAAAAPITSFATMNAQSDQLESGGGILVIPNAIEAETLNATGTAGIIPVKETPDPVHNPNLILSSGQHLFMPFTAVGQSVDIAIIEQYNPKLIELYLTKFSNYGVFDVYVNGSLVRQNLDLYSASLGVEKLDLGYHQPVDTRFTIRLKLVGVNSRGDAPKSYAAADAVVLKDLPSQLDSSLKWNLGEDDAEAIAGNTSNATTEESGDGVAIPCFGDPTYSSQAAPNSSLSMSYDGDDCHQVSGSDARTIIGTLDNNDLYLSAHVRPSAFDDFNFVISVGGNLPSGYGILYQAGKWGVIHQGQASSMGTIDAVIGTWQHLELKRMDFGSGVETRLFVDGVDAGTSISTAPSAISSYISIGANQLHTTTTEGYFKGKIDRIVIGNNSQSEYYTFIQNAFPGSNEINVIGTHADPDGDKISNAIEYLYQLHPNSANTTPQTTIQLKLTPDNVVSSSWPLNAQARKTIYWEIQASSDLVNWNTIRRSSSDNTADDQAISAQETLLPSQTRRFHRLFVPNQN